MKTSLITINYNRERHLNNLLCGVKQGSVLPDEVIVVNMGDTPDLEFHKNLNVHIVQIDGDKDENMLPIGQARNLGATHAAHDNLHFLDVDCIPEEDYFEKMNYFLKCCNGLIMANPRYLLHAAPADFKPTDLKRISKHHHKRPVINGIRKTDDAGLFWSLCFSITKDNFEKLGKFDNRYSGYGAEDTDLSFTCLEKGMNFYLCEATAYHQQHAFHAPPLDKMAGIISNCNAFYKKWNHWPMSKHLKAFEERGYINWKKDQTQPIELIKEPSAFITDQHYVNDQPYA